MIWGMGDRTLCISSLIDFQDMLNVFTNFFLSDAQCKKTKNKIGLSKTRSFAPDKKGKVFVHWPMNGSPFYEDRSVTTLDDGSKKNAHLWALLPSLLPSSFSSLCSLVCSNRLTNTELFIQRKYPDTTGYVDMTKKLPTNIRRRRIKIFFFIIHFLRSSNFY